MTYTRVRDPFSTSQNNSLNTLSLSNQTFSTWCWVGDYAQLSVQAGNASVLTLYGTDNDGWKSSLNTVTDASVITAIAAAGVYKVEPGFGWVQFQRSQSSQTVRYVGQTR